MLIISVLMDILLKHTFLNNYMSYLSGFIIFNRSMGSKQSVKIETPTYNPNEWQYIPQQCESPKQYGRFRSLRNKKTGEKIDEFDFLWQNQNEFVYYMQSFNWRYKQSSVVNSKFLQLLGKQELCSSTYCAKVYVQHIRVRISQISDIPFPDNLYVLMESLEGYSKVFQHSKYFQVEEDQICVDELGNVKIWVNADLSANYASSPDGYQEQKNKEEEIMVDAIISIIANNTDPQTEPSPSFKQFYQQRRGPRGKSFEEARVLVLSYARLHDTEIPARFEAILNLDKEEDLDLKSFTENGQSYQHNPNSKTQKVYYETEDRTQALPNALPSQPLQSYSFGPHNPPQILQNHMTYYAQPQQMVYSQHPQHLVYAQHQPYPQPYQQAYPQAAPVYYIPHYARIQYPSRQSIDQYGQPVNYQPIASANFQGQQIYSNGQSSPPIILGRQQNNRVAMRDDQQNFDDDSEEEQFVTEQNQFQEEHQEQREHHGSHGSGQGHMRNNSFRDQTRSISEADDLVARSLPLKAGHPSQNGQQLSAMGQSDRAAYSHINPKDQWQINADSFGLTKNSQLKLKQSALSNNKSARLPKPQVKSIKYFYSLDQQLEIDPDIAADMMKYLS